MSDCIFCKIAGGEIPSNFIWQDENVVAFHDINPRAPVHVLIVPKRHVVTYDELGEGDAGLMVSMAKAVTAVARAEGVVDSGYRLLVNNGPDGHQEVPHLHMHLFGGRPLGSMIKKAPEEG